MRPTGQLLLEPQNQSPPNQAILNQTLKTSTLTQNESAQTEGLRGADIASGKTQAIGAEQRVATPSIPDHLQPLVQQQLNALETRQVLWQGQVWQGQNMTWEVRDESPRRNAQGDEVNGQWITQIHLDMPKLGGVTARLSLTNGALNLAIDVTDAQTRKRLSSASSQLISALSERGIPVVHSQITENEHSE
jgi:flagellar hook-length control protein FliK